MWALTVARTVVTAGYAMVMPFLAMHLAVERNVGFTLVGLIWFVAGSLGALSQWMAGELADRIGRRPLLLAAMLLRALNLAAMGMAIAREASPLALAALTVANAVLRGFFDPVATALIADLVPAHQRVTAYALQRVGINLGWSAGPAIAAVASGVSYAHLFYASAPLTLLAAAAIWRIKEPGQVQTEAQIHGTATPRAFTVKELLAFVGDRRLLRFLGATLTFFLLQVQLYQSLSIYAASFLGMDRREVGTLYTVNGVLVVLLQLPVARLIQRWGTRRALVAGSLGYAASYAAVGFASGTGTLLLCLVGITLAEIFTSPAQQAAVTALAPAGRVGAYVGLFGLAQVVGQSTGPLVGTALLDVLLPRYAWLILATSGIVAAFGYRTIGDSRVSGKI